ncbi:MAG: chromosomal replication initiator protein DnaA [Anaerolineae bacterium]|nr:chromosomal replication initiator protein DnaA [Anaerolineae bacterium]
MSIENPQRLWQATLGELELQMPRATYDTWLRGTSCLGLEDNNRVVIGVKNGYAVEWLEDRLYPIIQRTLAHIAGEEMRARFVVWESKHPASLPPGPLLQSAVQPALVPDPGLNADYTFDNYIVGSGNRLAQAASMAVAESPARAYNPLFIYGGVGLGKTHLLHAIGQACYRMNLHVLYISSEEFTNDLVEAIRTHTTDTFRDKYRRTEVLLLDDVQFIAGKESTQEEFFHTFNALRDTGKQIVLTSDRPPKAMVTLEERLRSRLGWGLIVDIQPPDFETRLAILQKKAAQLQVEIPAEVLEFIAEHIESNIRELEGALNRVLAMTRLTHQPLTLEATRDALHAFLPNRPQLSSQEIIEAVATYYNLSLDELRSARRNKRIAYPRQIAMYLLREETGASLPQIGAQLGGRDHTTIMYGCARIRARMEEDAQVRREVLGLKTRLYERN